MSRLTDCPLCTGQEFRPLPKFAKDHLVRCRSCGFVFSCEKPTRADYDRVYGAYDYEAEDAARTSLTVKKERELAEHLAQFRQTNKVIDLAAGAGHFLERFRDLGFECHATEFNQSMLDYLSGKGFKTFGGGLFPEGVERGAYDIVIFTEIIEHINNPRPVLRNLASLLRPGGSVYVTTPNFSSLERRVIGPDWGMICWPEHITYWTPAHLHRALTESGLGKRTLRTSNISLYRVLEAMKKRGVGSNLSEQRLSDVAQQAVAGNPVLGLAKDAVNVLLGATGLGSSIQAVYVKDIGN